MRRQDDALDHQPVENRLPRRSRRMTQLVTLARLECQRHVLDAVGVEILPDKITETGRRIEVANQPQTVGVKHAFE